MSNIAIYLYICINILFFVSGFLIHAYFFGSKANDSIGFVYNNLSSKEARKKQEEEKILEKVKAVTIDDSIFVMEQDTESLEKHFDNITETKLQETNIQSSIDKLSQLRKGT